MSVRGAIAISVVVLVAWLDGVANASMTPEQRRVVLAEGEAAYDRGTAVLRTDVAAAHEAFVIAATRFQQLVDDGVVNGHLLSNLGNAYLRADDLGRAVLSYRAAERLIPGDARLEHNLEFARSLRRNRIAASGRRALGDALLGWHRRTPIALRVALFAGTYVGFWVLLAVQLFVPASAMRWGAVVCAAVWLGAGGSIATELLGAGSGGAGVVLRDDVVVRKGNGEGFEPRFEERLHAGVEFIRRDRRGDWVEIELPDGKSGWIRVAAAGFIDD